MTACIVGLAHTPFGKLDTESVESLIVRVAKEAIADAGIEAADVDEIVLGHFNAGFSAQDFTAALVLQADPAFASSPRRASRTPARPARPRFIRAEGDRREERARRARGRRRADDQDAWARDRKESFEGVLSAGRRHDRGRLRRRVRKNRRFLFPKYGDKSDALARIAAKNHKNGVANPYAQMRKDFGYEFCRTESDKNPRVAGPLKRTDCSLVSDGAAAIVLTDVETAEKLGKPLIAFRAAAHAQDFLPMSKRDILKFEGCTEAWSRALKQAGVDLYDLSFVETHDCFTIAELIEYEAMGLAKPGQGARLIDEGIVEKSGKLPVNPSGGLKAKGHPIGATGVSMHAISAMQLRGEAGDMQIKDARLAGIFNMGGAAVANYVSILERLR